MNFFMFSKLKYLASVTVCVTNPIVSHHSTSKLNKNQSYNFFCIVTNTKNITVPFSSTERWYWRAQFFHLCGIFLYSLLVCTLQPLNMQKYLLHLHNCHIYSSKWIQFHKNSNYCFMMGWLKNTLRRV